MFCWVFSVVVVSAAVVGTVGGFAVVDAAGFGAVVELGGAVVDDVRAVVLVVDGCAAVVVTSSSSFGTEMESWACAAWNAMARRHERRRERDAFMVEDGA